MKKRAILLAVVLVLAINLVFASVEYKGNTLKKDYADGDLISGKVNVSIINEPITSYFASNVAGNISIISLLNKSGYSEGAGYNCTSIGCGKSFVKQNSITSLNLNGNTKYFGFELTGSSVSVQSFNFTLASDIGPSCAQQLSLKLIPESNLLVQNDKSNGVLCAQSSNGCFNSSLSAGSYINVELPDQMQNALCENITISPSAGYMLGAELDKKAGGNGAIYFDLYDQGMNQIGGEDGICTVDSGIDGYNSCKINYTSLDTRNVFVCIYSETAGSYEIRTENSGQVCGKVKSNAFDRDYEISVKGLTFSNVNFNIHPDAFIPFTSDNAVDKINAYLSSKYGGNCANGCIIPFEISGPTQTASFSGINVRYTAAGNVLNSQNLYSLANQDSKINGNNILLDMSKSGFTISLGSKPATFDLYLNTSKLAAIPINVTTGLGFDLSPRFAFIGVDTLFSLISNFNVTSISWNFGDGGIGTTTGKSLIHKYTSAGTFNLKVDVTKNATTTSRTFEIIVGDPNQSISSLIKNNEDKLSNLTIQLASFSTFTSAQISNKLNLSSVRTEVASIKLASNSSTSEEQKGALLGRLLAIDLPNRVYMSKTGTLPLSLGLANANLEQIKAVAGMDDVSFNDDDLKKAIASWGYINYDAKMEFKQISALKSSGKEEILTSIKIIFNPKSESKAGYLLIGRPLGELAFASGYSPIEAGSGTAVPIGTNTEIEFSLIGEVKAAELGMYISPSLTDLNVDFTLPAGETNKERVINWWFLGIGLGILLIIVLVAYVFLQEWYKKYYESHLFKNKDDLYNLINFIYNSRTSGLKDDEIKNKLRKSGWTMEQIIYALRKIDGKRTGMFEIPLFKSGENKAVVDELTRRQGGQLDRKYIGIQ